MDGAEVRVAPATSVLDHAQNLSIAWLSIPRLRRSLAVVTWFGLTIGGYVGYAVLISRLFHSWPRIAAWAISSLRRRRFP